MAKRRFSGFAFDPPSHGVLPTPTGAKGLGEYYAGLKMNKWEVNKRLQSLGMDRTETGKAAEDHYMKARG